MLSVCLIIKNEEKNIGRCLNSVKDIADEIIVVDTGSTDNSIEIAKSYTSKVYNYTWNEDFSAARNESIKYATKEYILILDADEELHSEDATTLIKLIKENPDKEGFYFNLINIINKKETGKSVVFRLFKNNEAYRFEGKIHEQIIGSILKDNSSNALLKTYVRINHYGYDYTKTNLLKKFERNIAILNSYDNFKKDGYYYYSLGNEYARIKNYDIALENYKKALEYKYYGLNIYYPYLVMNICKILMEKKEYIQCIDYIKLNLINMKNFKDLYFYLYLSYIAINKFTFAKDALLKYINCTNENYEYPSNNFDSNMDINSLLQQSDSYKIPHKNKLLSTVITITKSDAQVLNTIKSLNEISENIYVLYPNDVNINMSSIQSFGGKLIKVDNAKDLLKNLYKVYIQCNTTYLLFLNEDEILPLDSQSDLLDLLENNYSKKFNYILPIINVSTCKTEQENTINLLFKDNSIDTLEEFTDFYMSNERKTSEISILKFKEVH